MLPVYDGVIHAKNRENLNKYLAFYLQIKRVFRKEIRDSAVDGVYEYTGGIYSASMLLYEYAHTISYRKVRVLHVFGDSSSAFRFLSLRPPTPLLGGCIENDYDPHPFNTPRALLTSYLCTIRIPAVRTSTRTAYVHFLCFLLPQPKLFMMISSRPRLT